MEEWGTTLINSLEEFGIGLLNFLPKFFLALIVFVVGWFIAVVVGKIITEILKRLRLDKFFEARGWKEAMEKAEIKTTISEFIGTLCKWILIIVFLAIAVEFLARPSGFSAFLYGSVIPWLGNLLVAIAIFVVVAIIANFAEKATRASLEKAKVGFAALGASIVKWAIWIFGIFAILTQLGIGKDLLLTLFQGLVALLAIAGGLAFGLGGKELAGELLNSLKDKLKR
jgi:large-conductance mechanosensitive channel